MASSSGVRGWVVAAFCFGCSGPPQTEPAVAAAALHAAAAPLFGPEIELAPPAYTDKKYEQMTPRVASGGGVSLVAWWSRDTAHLTPSRVYAARVSSEGKVLDPLGIQVSSPQGEHERVPQVAWNGTVFFVLWQHQDVNDQLLRGARVSLDGKVLDPAGIDIAVEARTHETPFLASNGRDFLVLYTHVELVGTEFVDTVRARRVRADGVVEPATIAPLVPRTDEPVLRALGSNGSDYLFVHTRRDIGTSWRNVARRLDASGAPLGAPVELDDEPSYGWFGDVAWDGSRYLACWTRYKPETSTDGSVFCRRLDSAGQRLDAAALVLNLPGTSPHDIFLDWTGASFSVLWDQPDQATGLGEVFGRRVTSAGQPIEAAPVLIAPRAQGPFFAEDATWNGTSHLVVATRPLQEPGIVPWSPFGVQARRVDASFAAKDAAFFPVSTEANQQEDLRLATDGSAFFAVWQDDRGRDFLPAGTVGRGLNTDVYGALLGVQGSEFRSREIPIASTVYREWAPFVVWNGQQFLTGANDYRNEKSSLGLWPFGRDGAPGAPSPANVSAFASKPAAVWNGKETFVFWQDGPDVRNTVQFRRLSASNQVVGGAAVTVSGFILGVAPRAAAAGEDVMVVWTRKISGATYGEYDEEVYGNIVNGAGELLTKDGFPIATGPGDQNEPVVASDGSGFLVLWKDAVVEASPRVVGARVDKSGKVTPLAAPLSRERMGAPALAWAHDAYVALWVGTDPADHAIEGTMITADGTALPARGFAAGVLDSKPLEPVLVWGAADRGVLAYIRMDTAANVQKVRGRARLITMTAAAPLPVVDAGAIDASVAIDTSAVSDTASASDTSTARDTSTASDASVARDTSSVASDASAGPDLAGPPDALAGIGDGGAAPPAQDAGSADPGASPDAATSGGVPATAGASTGGCSCHVGARGGSGSAGVLATIVLGAWLGRGRRRASQRARALQLPKRAKSLG